MGMASLDGLHGGFMQWMAEPPARVIQLIMCQQEDGEITRSFGRGYGIVRAYPTESMFRVKQNTAAIIDEPIVGLEEFFIAIALRGRSGGGIVGVCPARVVPYRGQNRAPTIGASMKVEKSVVTLTGPDQAVGTY
jgi:hypothetical protein